MSNIPAVIPAPDEALFEVERRIARRADELTRLASPGAHPALECWLQAEREVWRDTPGRSARSE